MKTEPTVLIDTREQRPLAIAAYPTESATLPVGDYGVKGLSDWNCPRFIVERKSLNDLVGSLTKGRKRFFRELEKLRQFGFAGLLIEASRLDVEMGNYRSATSPQSILASLDAIAVRCGVHIFFCGDPEGAARQLEGLVRQFVRGIEKEHAALAKAGEVAA